MMKINNKILTKILKIHHYSNAYAKLSDAMPCLLVLTLGILLGSHVNYWAKLNNLLVLSYNRKLLNINKRICV